MRASVFGSQWSPDGIGRGFWGYRVMAWSLVAGMTAGPMRQTRGPRVSRPRHCSVVCAPPGSRPRAAHWFNSLILVSLVWFQELN